MTVTIAGIAIPDTPMARAATIAGRGNAPDILFRHSSRVFLFASLLGARRDATFDPELLHVAATFQNFGLAARFRDSKRRFEVDSANAARHFLLYYGIPEREIIEVWNAVALHTTFGISDHPCALVGLLSAGVETDLMALHLDEITESQRREVLLAFPRERGFKSLVIEAFAEGMWWRPETTFGTVNADVLDRCDPNYKRINYCGLILGSDWAD
ncbi:MAG: hypothetical protein QOC89_1375 [Paraburkholderia sp.]|jgi:hypothetical protein|uniref:phosphohydrolase n=1 Tax=Paraburkholderia sp. TaxID=1926495 RepID=UPI002AFFA846|nr:phosphohydrolase [Paraburkholderia sp.]MEA3083678.1 hypothetical protein [Paraburkholderia sp.]